MGRAHAGDREPAAPPSPPRAVMSVDLEEWFHICGVPGLDDPAQWPRLASRVRGDTHRLLQIFAEHGAKATFFVLGWVAERHPDLVASIHDAGHEIASHGYTHRRLTDLEPSEFRDEVAGSRDLLEDIVGRPVVGYRAPEWSLTRETFWALDVLADEGYLYDSSSVPLTGMGDRVFLPGPHRIATSHGSILEIPVSTFRVFWERVPFSGGLPMRFAPDWFIPYELGRSIRRDGIGVAYVHPWELDPRPPRLALPRSRRFMHYFRLGAMRRKLETLLRSFRFDTFSNVLGFGDPAVAADGIGTPRAEEPMVTASRKALP